MIDFVHIVKIHYANQSATLLFYNSPLVVGVLLILFHPASDFLLGKCRTWHRSPREISTAFLKLSPTVINSQAILHLEPSESRSLGFQRQGSKIPHYNTLCIYFIRLEYLATTSLLVTEKWSSGG